MIRFLLLTLFLHYHIRQLPSTPSTSLSLSYRTPLTLPTACPLTSRDAVLRSTSSLKVVGEPIKPGTEGRGVFVQGLTPRAIAQEGGGGKRAGSNTKPKTVRGWLMKADTNRRQLAKDLKAGDGGLKRACCVTIFEILQLSEMRPELAAAQVRRE